jgi:D-sedoheptulose 7-phosphate isomerase
MTSYTEEYLAESHTIIESLDRGAIDAMVEEFAALKARQGRLFIIGSGGGAAHAGHAVCDFRKIGGIEAYSPSDNLAELTARVNDDGWASAYSGWLKASRMNPEDLLLVISVGGGNSERGLSMNLSEAIWHASKTGTRICGIVGRRDGETARLADVCVCIPQVNANRLTAHTEGFQSVLLHLLVTHPRVAAHQPVWEASGTP